jgi:hypothetical protein
LIRSRETLDYLRRKYEADVDVVAVLDEVDSRRRVEGLATSSLDVFLCASCGTRFSDSVRAERCAELDRKIDESKSHIRAAKPDRDAA